METWEKDYVRSNLVSLVEEIDSSKLLPFLLQSNIISRSDKDELEVIGRQIGRMKQSDKLLDILPGRTNGYQHLAKALHIFKQTGPLLTLLYGIQINTLQNPFRYCEIELNINEILSKKVYFEGNHISLSEICKLLNQNQLISLKERIDVSIFRSLICSDEVTIAKETIPTVIPYYIKRTLTLRNNLNTQIFRDRQQDYFLIKNIEPHQLTLLAQSFNIKDNTRLLRRHQVEHMVSTSVSSYQMRGLTSRFILLENDQHFDLICKVNRDKIIHCIIFHNNSYFLERSSSPQGVKNYILNNEMQMTEESFLKSVSDNDNNPVIIYDTPGMGKSVVLTSLACQVKIKNPTEYVMYFEMQDLVNKLQVRKCNIDISVIESFLIDTISINKFGSFINRELFRTPHRNICVFLDAFDEVNSDQQELAISVVKLLCDHRHMYKIHITSRPHQGDVLENVCGVIGYGIHPFNLQEQMDFLVEYWQSQYFVHRSDQVFIFAKNVLSAFRDKISTKDREITGIPLQCRMLADVYAKDVQIRSFSLIYSKIQLDTIYDMYREYFYQKFPDTRLQPGKSKLLDMHFKLALKLLFPEFSEKMRVWQELECEKDIFSIGIVEVNKSGGEQFVHRTFAEFLVAEFVASYMGDEIIDLNITTNMFLSFLFTHVLGTRSFRLHFEFHSLDDQFNQTKLSCYPVRFKFPVLTFLLGHSISNNNLFDKLHYLFTASEYKDTSFSSWNWGNILMACIENNSISLYKLMTNLPIKYFDEEQNNDFLDPFSEFMMTFVPNLSFPESHFVIASHFSSLELLKLSVAFISTLIEKPLNCLKYRSESKFLLTTPKTFCIHPILVAAKRGDYHIFEFVFGKLMPKNIDDLHIIYNCIHNSFSDSLDIVEGKLQILKLLSQRQTSAHGFDIKNVSLFNCDKLHMEVILFLFDQGINVFETDSWGNTIAHIVGSYLSAEEYHRFVEWLVEHKLSNIFKHKDHEGKTPVYEVLYCLEVSCDTLQTLSGRCNVNFNAKDKYGQTELISAIEGGRSVSVLQKLVELGADINTQNMSRCTVLCHAVESDNIDALKYFLSLGVSPNKRCRWLFSNIWDHVLLWGNRQSSSKISDVVILLIQNGADVNSATRSSDDCSSLICRPASVKLKSGNLDRRCVDVLNEKFTVSCNLSSCLLSLCCCTLCICSCHAFKPCGYCQHKYLSWLRESQNDEFQIVKIKIY